MKNFIVLTVLVILANNVNAQDGLVFKPGLSIAARSYAPITGAILNSKPVVELYTGISKGRFSGLIFKSNDFTDTQSGGNYTLL